MIRPILLAALWLGGLFAAAAVAAPPLSTIQDVLYKADGTKFAGVVTIDWTSFQAVDTSNIATQSTTIRIVDGVLSVQLVPTTNASGGAFYNVRYTSDGRVQFSERWAVRSSPTPLKLRDVRISSVSSGTSSALASILVADVTGLPQELDLRPVKAPSYSPSHAVLINATGALESVAGNLSDCVHVDGTSGPCGTSGGGGGSPLFVDAETPAGTVDGSNAQFILLSAPSPVTSLSLYRNGVLQKQGFDYALNGNVISFVAPAVPQPADVLLASYRSVAPASLTVTPVEVLCGGTGLTTSGQTVTELGRCTVAAGLLAAGDRIEIRFEYSHQGPAAFTAEVRWGNTIVLSRNGTASDTLFTGRIEAAVSEIGTSTSTQSWGTQSTLAVSAVLATDSLSNPIDVVFSGGSASGSSDQLALRNFTVLRYPAR